MTRLTANQSNLLSVLDRSYRTGPQLAERLYDDRSRVAVEGVHTTAASLVRRGFAERTKIMQADRRGSLHKLVCYRLSDAGAAAREEPV